LATIFEKRERATLRLSTKSRVLINDAVLEKTNDDAGEIALVILISVEPILAQKALIYPLQHSNCSGCKAGFAVIKAPFLIEPAWCAIVVRGFAFTSTDFSGEPSSQSLFLD
jgi:hypothetical protein